MDAASAVKAHEAVDGLHAEGPPFGRVMETVGAAPLVQGMQCLAARRFFPCHCNPGTSRADDPSAGWREFLLRTGLGEFTTPPLLAASAAGRRGRWAAPTGRARSPCRHPDGPREDGIGEVDAATSVTCTR
jgi:hypothetical protein